MPRVALNDGASNETLREQLDAVVSMRLAATAGESWSAAANLLRQETELRGLIDARTKEPGAVLGEMTEGALVERLALALSRLPAVMRDSVFERVAQLDGVTDA